MKGGKDILVVREKFRVLKYTENMFAALGEKVGWRGAMYPYLKEKLGVTMGRIVGGVIWVSGTGRL